MLHEVQTAVKGELVAAQLPPFAGEKRVRAARIVALGMGPQPGTTRLALEGGAHVDVGKAWMQKHGAAIGHYYVQSSDGETTEALPADAFEGSFLPTTEEPAAEGEQSAEQTVTLDGEVVKVSEIEGAFSKLVQQVHTLTLERDGARSRITELEKELAQERATNQLIIEGTAGSADPEGGTFGTGTGPAPTAEDLDKTVAQQAEEQAAKDATSGETQQEQGPETQQS